MLIRARFVALLASGIVASCVLPERGGGNISVGGNDGSGGSSGTGGSNGTGGAGNDTQHTGGSVIVPPTGGSPGVGGSTGSFTPTGGAVGHSCASGVAGNTSSCVCNGGCAGSGGHIPCPSGWINKDQTCATIRNYGCDVKDAVEPPYCDAATLAQNRCLYTLPQYFLLSTKVTLTEDARIVSLGAVVGTRSTPFRVAVYSDLNGHPNDPIVQTSGQLTYSNPVEDLNPTQILTAGDYWLTILADPGQELGTYLVEDDDNSLFVTNEIAGNLNGVLWPWPAGPDLASKLVPFTSSRQTLFSKSQLHVFAHCVRADASPSN